MLVDVHAHLTYPRFDNDVDQVVQKCIDRGLSRIVVNGLDPLTNRKTLTLAQKYPDIIKSALGIYPADAVNDMLAPDIPPHQREKFNVQDEIDFIAAKASAKEIIAVGECGLDGHWLKEETFAKQEQVFEQLIEIAKVNDIPVIVHSRKREERTLEVLYHNKATKVVMHCFGGTKELAQTWAEKTGWSFSIPANAESSRSFMRIMKNIPRTSVLTETDSPYLAPNRNERNDPSNVVVTVRLFAKLLEVDYEEAQQIIWNNYLRLFEPGN